jgi:uncharacterized protein YecT (DUF1311 family)
MRSIRAVFIIFASVSPVAVSAWACDLQKALSQSEMNECAGENFKASDKQLNILYEQIMARIGGDAATKGLLQKSQRLWIGFRDAECDFQASGSVGGSIYPTLIASCAGSMTDKRILEFKEYSNCEEGDSSCPVPHR